MVQYTEKFCFLMEDIQQQENSDFFSSLGEEQINEAINNDSDNTYMDGAVRISMDEWLHNSRFSPNNFKKNVISSTDAFEMSGKLLYKLNDETGNNELLVCSASIKSSPYSIESIEPENEKERVEGITIYGHCDDLDDSCASRFDSKFIKKISTQFHTAFRYVMITGAFESIKVLQDVISMIEQRMLEKSPYSRIRVGLDSKTLDDEGNARTIASLINSGYIDREILPGRSIVEYVFKRFNRTMTAQLFTKTLVVNNVRKNLFDDIEEPNNKKIEDLPF